MANTTVRNFINVHGTNPQFLIEKVIRSRIYDSMYWKEKCFALTAETIIDEAVQLHYVGGTYANTRPSEFLCLALKLLQLQPEKEIILEYLRAEEFKYLRALAAFYVRLTFTPINVYLTLEPLLADYRKLRMRKMDGSYYLSTIDDFADDLLTDERVCEIILPRLTQRRVLEETEGLGRRKSQLAKVMGIDEDALLASDDDDEEAEGTGVKRRRDGPDVDIEEDRFVSRSPTPASEDSRSPPPDDDRFISRSPSPERYISRSPTPEGERIDGDV